MAQSDWNGLNMTARTRLSEYISALYIGRSGTSKELDQLYLERLATAAHLVTLLSPLSNVDRMREIIRQENRAFPKFFLSTDAGRAARGAFNALARAVYALEELKRNAETRPTAPKSILGTTLSAVTFIWDYVQLEFSGRGFNVFCPIELRCADQSLRSEEPGFRDRLCGLIGQRVRDVDDSGAHVEIAFDRDVIKFPSTSEDSSEGFTFFDTDA
jgi:hypothetical protein